MKEDQPYGYFVWRKDQRGQWMAERWAYAWAHATQDNGFRKSPISYAHHPLNKNDFHWTSWEGLKKLLPPPKEADNAQETSQDRDSPYSF